VYRVTGCDLSEAHIRRAIELSEEKYCSIYATLRDMIAIASVIEILE
jgi:uncharacterized OsmC-like protein